MLRGDILGGLQGAHATFGDVVDVQIGATRFHFVSSPAGVEHVLVKNRYNYRKSNVTKRAKPLLGNGLFTNDGESWRTQWRLMRPAFHQPQIANLTTTMAATIGEMLERWEQGAWCVKQTDGEQPTGDFDLSAELNHLSIQIMMRGLFGSAISAETAREITDALTYLHSLFQQRALMPFEWISRIPLPPNKKAQPTLDMLDATLFEIIVKQRQTVSPNNHLLALLIAAQDEESGIGMSDQQLRDEVMTLFVTGCETTASHLQWTLWLLDQNPAWRARLSAEIDTNLTGRTPTMADVPQLTITRQIINESLRLYPPAWILGHRAINRDSLLRYDIQPGTTIIMSPYVLHRHPDLWKTPDKFNPHRFADTAMRPRFAYWPFGGGSRQCVGDQFALLGSTLTLAMIHQQYSVQIESNNVEPLPSLTLRPKKPLLATLKPK